MRGMINTAVNTVLSNLGDDFNEYFSGAQTRKPSGKETQ
jgi:hypothetical protein